MTITKSLWRKIANIATTVITVLIVAICGLLLFTKSSGDIVFIGNKSCVYVMSESMEPLIPTGSFIVVEKVDAKDVSVDDIIIFKSDDPSIKDSFNTHQVIDIIGDHEAFVTKGINNTQADVYKARAENVYGRYVKNATLLNRFAEWFLTTHGLIITALIIFAICCGIYLPDILHSEDSAEEDALLREETENAE